MNPYQQNIDIIKGFFKRKIVLLYAIFTILPIFSIVFIDANSLINTISEATGSNIITNASQTMSPAQTLMSLYSVFVIDILLAVVFLLFFVKSGSKESSLNAPIGIFRVVSVIELVITVLIALASVLAVMFASLHIMSSYSPVVSILSVPFMFAAIPVFLLLIVSQTVFSGNIKESVNSIYLKKNGAKLFGIMNFITAAFCLYFIAIIIIFINSYDSENSFNYAFTPVAVFADLTVVKFVFGGILGIKYAKYIEDFSDSSTARETNVEEEAPASDVIVCKNCGNPLKPEDYFCNHCGTPVEKQ